MNLQEGAKKADAVTGACMQGDQVAIFLDSLIP